MGNPVPEPPRPHRCTRGRPDGVHRRVPAHGGRQGTDRRPGQVPRAARPGIDGLGLARRLPRDPPQGRLGRPVGQGRGPADHRSEIPSLPALRVLARGRGRDGQAGPGPASRLPARIRSASAARPCSSARAITRRSGHRTGGTPTARRSTTRRSWPRPSRAWGSSSEPYALPGSARDPIRSGWRRDARRAPAGAGGRGHRDARACPRQPSHRRHPGRRWAHRADPGGGQSRWPPPRSRCRPRSDRPCRGPSRPAVRRPTRPPPGELPGAGRRSRPAAGFGAVDGCLFDLGLSSFQLADRERGFGFRAGGPLDMRFDPSRGVPASELLASLDTAELTALFRRYGEEPKAPRIARAIVDARRVAPDLHGRGAGRARRARPPAEPAPAAPDAPGDPRLPGAADRGQRGARRAAGRPRRRPRPAPPGRPARRPELPLARGPHRQAVLPGRAARLRLPARAAGLRLRPEPAPAPRDQPVADPDRRRDRRQPTSSERPTAGRRATRRLAPRTGRRSPR